MSALGLAGKCPYGEMSDTRICSGNPDLTADRNLKIRELPATIGHPLVSTQCLMGVPCADDGVSTRQNIESTRTSIVVGQ